MSRFLVVTTDYPAHLDWGGLLKTAVHLRDSGHQVLWATGGRAGRLVAQAGIDVRRIPVVDPHKGLPMREDSGPSRDRSAAVSIWRAALAVGSAEGGPQPAEGPYTLLVRMLCDAWLQETAIQGSCDAVLGLIASFRADVVIAEPLMLPGAIAADAAGVPLASCGYPGALLTVQALPTLAGTINDARTMLTRLKRRVGIRVEQSSDVLELFFKADRLQIVYFPLGWFAEYGGARSPGAVYVGSEGAGGEWPGDPLSSAGAPLVVIAASTSYRPDGSIIGAMFDAIGRVGARATIGGEHELGLGDLKPPDYVSCVDWLDYDQILPRASLLMHHGGLGTTHAGVRCAVPQLIMPGPVDQGLHAFAAARSGLALVLTGSLTAASIAAGIQEVVRLRSYRERAVDARREFAAGGGVAEAARHLVLLASSHGGSGTRGRHGLQQTHTNRVV